MEGAITLVRKAAIGGVCGYVFGSPAAMDVPPPPPASTDTPAEMTTPVAMPALDPASLATSFVVGCFVSTIADVVTWPLEALSEGASGASGGGGLLAAVKQRGGLGAVMRPVYSSPAWWAAKAPGTLALAAAFAAASAMSPAVEGVSEAAQLAAEIARADKDDGKFQERSR